MLKKFWIVTNDGKDTNHAVTEKVKELLEIAGRSCILCEKDAEKNIIRERIPDMIDCAIVIGGDGSLIEVARTLWKRDVPILGINMGTLGYLTEVEVSNLAEDITQMLKGDYLYEERMMLESMFPPARFLGGAGSRAGADRRHRGLSGGPAAGGRPPGGCGSGHRKAVPAGQRRKVHCLRGA